MSPEQRAAAEIESVRPIVGLEVHVELRTRRKMFAPSASPAHPEFESSPANTLLDPVVLALPGALPVMNRLAIELSIRVGLALGCSIAKQTKWDRKGYTYPDLPKGYQISQYDLPLCFDGRAAYRGLDARGNTDPEGGEKHVGIIRAHLEEDAGKLLHEAPGGAPVPPEIGGSIVDLNRAGTPLLEIVTQPEFSSSEDVVAFCKHLRRLCRFVGATEGVMQKGHMRFEPNINCVITLSGGRTVTTPIVEIKNLNSFRAVGAAIDHELSEQPKRWREDGLVMGRGMKSTRGWDDARAVTVPQREKEDAHDYRYFPDPDLPMLEVDPSWVEQIRRSLPETPLHRLERYVEAGLSAGEADVILEERGLADRFDEAVVLATESGIDGGRAHKAVANVLLQHGARLANERACGIEDLPIDAGQLASLAKLREDGAIQSSNAGELVAKLCEPGFEGRDPAGVAEFEGWLVVRDEGALEAWVDEVIAANGPIVEQIRAGKQQAIGRLIGEVMKKSGGSADAKAAREKLLERIGS